MTLYELKGKGSPSSTTDGRVPELIPVLGSQPAGDVSHKPGGRLPLLSARTAVTLATIKRQKQVKVGSQLPSEPLRGLLPISLLGEQRHGGCKQFA